MKKNTLQIASRKSHLARLQSYLVATEIKKTYPLLEISFHFSESLGDKNLVDPLWKLPDKGVFTSDLTGQLKNGSFDLVVHSWKDLPTELSPGTEIFATLPRADVRDLLIFKKSSRNKTALKILSSSPRRAYNLGKILPELLPGNINSLEFESVRGNVPTRMKKLLETPHADALVLAKAGIDRLLTLKSINWDLALPGDKKDFESMAQTLAHQLNEFNLIVLPLEHNPPAAAQGALALEIRSNDEETKNLLNNIQCLKTFEDVQKERATLKSHGGGCHQKIGVHFAQTTWGTLHALKGKTDIGEELSAWTNLSAFPIKLNRVNNTQSKLWSGNSKLFFERSQIKFNLDEINSLPALWISRSHALPDSYTQRDHQILWCSGVETWKKLARRGFWVTGSSEGLGEGSAPDLCSLYPHLQNHVWTKLTHLESPSNKTSFKTIATYELSPKSFSNNEHPNLESLLLADHCYWMSGSSFLEALKKFKGLSHVKTHSSGPGITHQIIKEKLGPSFKKIFIFANKKDWEIQIQNIGTNSNESTF